MMEMKLELVPVPVSDVDRAKAFYAEQCGFHLEVDVLYARFSDPDGNSWLLQEFPASLKRH